MRYILNSPSDDQCSCYLWGTEADGIPIYYLDVNTKIKIVDNERGISGDYLVNKLTIPLTYNGTMNITATNVVKGIY